MKDSNLSHLASNNSILKTSWSTFLVETVFIFMQMHPFAAKFCICQQKHITNQLIEIVKRFQSKMLRELANILKAFYLDL